jgi:surface polysaccharide O-acyltransferase-like enzyme
LPVLDGVSENAYGIYLFHYVVVLWTQYLLLDISLPAIVKGLIVFSVTLALSWAAAAGLARIPVVGRIIGPARRRKPQPAKPKLKPLSDY